MIPVLLIAVLLFAAAVSYGIVSRRADRFESPVPLALFRITYGAILFLEVAQMYYYEHLITDPVPWLGGRETHLIYPLWLAVIACLTLGLFTRAMTVANYVIGFVTISGFHDFEYHVDYIITGLNLLLLVTPVSQRLSLDSLRATHAAARAGISLEPPQVSALYRTLFVFVGLGLVYFDSTFWKLASPMWTAGLGVWLPASLPHITWLDMSPFLDREWLAKGLGYLTLIFEMSFIVLMWFRALAVPLTIVGVGLHLGIAAAFPIPWFGLTCAALYLLVLPPSVYTRLGGWRRGRVPTLTLRAAAGNDRVPGSRERAAATSQDEVAGGIVRSSMPGPAKIALGILIGALIVGQAAAIVQSPIGRAAARRLGGPELMVRLATLGRQATRSVWQPFMGVTAHPVFMDFHFQGYNHIVTIVETETGGEDVWLPMFRPSGHAHWMSSGRIWVHWNWRCVASRIQESRLSKCVRLFTEFWLRQQGRGDPIADSTFRILVKRTDVPTAWKAGFLRRQKAREWLDGGVAQWRDGKFEASLRPLETL